MLDVNYDPAFVHENFTPLQGQGFNVASKGKVAQALDIANLYCFDE